MDRQKTRKLVLFLMFFLLPFSLNIFSPVVVIMSTAKGIAGITFYVWTTMLVTSLLMGRSFCAYICPYGGMQMTVHAVQQKPLVKIKGLQLMRYGFGGVWLGIIVYLLVRSGGLKTQIFFGIENGASIDDIMGVVRYYAIVGTLVIMALVLGRRAVCKYLCPMSILNTIGNWTKNKMRVPSLRLYFNNLDCIACKQCTRSCPMSLAVDKMVQNENLNHNDCILCGECANICPKKVIGYGFKRGEASSKDQ